MINLFCVSQPQCPPKGKADTTGQMQEIPEIQQDFGDLRLAANFFETCRFAGTVSEVTQFVTAYFTVTDNLDFVDDRGV